MANAVHGVNRNPYLDNLIDTLGFTSAAVVAIA